MDLGILGRDFLDPAPHGLRGDSLEQSWEMGVDSAPFSAGPRRFVLEETEDGVWGADRAVGMCGQELSVGLP